MKKEDLSGFWETSPKNYKAWKKTEALRQEYIELVVVSLLYILLAFIVLLIWG